MINGIERSPENYGRVTSADKKMYSARRPYFPMEKTRRSRDKSSLSACVARYIYVLDGVRKWRARRVRKN